MENIEHYKKAKFQDLLEAPVKNCKLTLEWSREFHDGPGIYIIKISNKIVYVGETSNLQKRMNDFRNTKNHTLRRNLGNDLFMKDKGFEKATAKKSFTIPIEEKLENYMKRHLKFRTLPLYLGRKELEEYIIETNGKPIYNIRANKRLNSKKK